MIILILFILLINIQSLAAVDFGIGSSSFTGGRPIPALALGIDSNGWGVLYRSVGVQTTIYAQNAWTVAGYKTAYSEKFGSIGAMIGVGGGSTYILRTFRKSPSDNLESSYEFVLGPLLSLKFEWGPVFLGFDTLLGLTRQIVQHIVLNFQDVSQVTIGVTF